MAQKIRYMTTLATETISKIKQIGEANRWNDNDCIEVAIDALHSRTFNTPNPSVTVESAIKIANQPAIAE